MRNNTTPGSPGQKRERIKVMRQTKTIPIPSWLPQPATNLLLLLVFESDVQRLLAIGRADVKMLVAEGRLKSVTMPDGTRRITLASVSKILRRANRRGSQSERAAPKGTALLRVFGGPVMGTHIVGNEVMCPTDLRFVKRGHAPCRLPSPSARSAASASCGASSGRPTAQTDADRRRFALRPMGQA